MLISVLSGVEAPADITVFMTTSQNGVMFSGGYAGMRRCGESYALLKRQFGIEDMITLQQHHSADILEVDRESYSSRTGALGDGLFTASKELALGILTADCYPVLLAGGDHIAALHCGWRGTVKGIIANAVKLFEANGDKPGYAYVGAGITKNAFCVQSDFIVEVERYIAPEPYLSEKRGEFYFDLAGLINDQLNYHCIDTVEYAGLCSYGDNRFHSYRRDGKEAGRMLSVICRS